MKEGKSKIVGVDGKELKSVTIPTVKFRDFQFAIQMIQPNDIARPTKEGIRPGDIIHEFRSRCAELEDRIQILTAILCTVIQEGPEVGKEFLDSIGARVTDLNNKVLYEPKTSN